MADNYLERKMEEHRNSGAAPKKKTPQVAGHRQGEICIKFPPRRVLVTGGANGIGRAVVQAFRNADCIVDFIDSDRRNGQLTAQQTGARFIPADIASACLFLALPDYNFINGADIVIDGGMTHKMIYV